MVAAVSRRTGAPLSPPRFGELIGEYRLGISGRLKGKGPYESIGQTGDSFPSAVVLVRLYRDTLSPHRSGPIHTSPLVCAQRLDQHHDSAAHTIVAHARKGPDELDPFLAYNEFNDFGWDVNLI